MHFTRISLVVAALLATACGPNIGLTERGTTVQRVERGGLPDGCRLVGDVAIGIPPDAGRPRTEEQLAMLMRNKAGELGANHVIVEFSEPRGTGAGAHFVGSGTAYACDESAVRPPPAEPAAADDETTSGDEAALAE
ncbi:MAG: hypothetical protein M3Y87_36980 [Myxococcota bacterium]|nr:hypothetical protein [Myxococcota bacterium]